MIKLKQLDVDHHSGKQSKFQQLSFDQMPYQMACKHTKQIDNYLPDKKWYYCRCKQRSLFSYVPCRHMGQHL